MSTLSNLYLIRGYHVFYRYVTSECSSPRLKKCTVNALNIYANCDFSLSKDSLFSGLYGSEYFLTPYNIHPADKNEFMTVCIARFSFAKHKPPSAIYQCFHAVSLSSHAQNSFPSHRNIVRAIEEAPFFRSNVLKEPAFLFFFLKKSGLC